MPGVYKLLIENLHREGLMNSKENSVCHTIAKIAVLQQLLNIATTSFLVWIYII